MLRSLSIRNYALIDSLDVEFPDNLVVISGETGAGKSILLGAISLLLGSRTDVSQFGDKSANCVVEGEFTDGSDSYIIRRVITPQGRSRVFVNDEPVGVEALRGLASSLVDIHTQFAHSRLADASYQLSLLDSFAGTATQVKEFGALFGRRCAVASEIAALDAAEAASDKNRDYVKFQYDQLEAAALRDGELEELEAEQKQLSGSEAISAAMARIESLFSSEEGSVGGSLKSLESSLEEISRYVPDFAPLCGRVASARVELSDIEYEVLSKGSRISFSPQRMQEVDDRLSLLYDLLRKHGVEDIKSLIDLRDGYAKTLSAAEDSGAERERLAASLKTLDAECDHLAQAIGKARRDASSRLAATLQELARSLEMPEAVFEVRVTPKQRCSSGDEGVEFWFSANGGVGTKPLADCASGGELSRIMLCIKRLTSEYMNMPAMIFDEIDTGVSGSVADKMGRMIVEMGRNMQVFAITHLPQVASKGSAHFLVFKQMENGVTRSRMRPLSGEDRVAEIARMLSGASLSKEALANARVLLNEKPN